MKSGESKNIAQREGFSLIELIISIAIVAIVMSSVLVLISYSTNNMRRTTNTVTLQNQTKDALTHITTYLQEGSTASWDDANKALTIVKYSKDSAGTNISAEISYYWQDVDDKLMYFYKTTCEEVEGAGIKIPELNSEGEIDFTKLTQSSYESLQTDDRVFVRNVVDFSCEDLRKIATTVPTAPEEPATSVDPAAETTPTPEPTSTPEATATPVTYSSISGEAWRVTINMENETGDAKFTSTKDIYLRNQ